MLPLQLQYEPLAQSTPSLPLHSDKMSRTTRTLLYVSMALMMLSSAIEMAFISSMVYWLHYRAGKAFEVNYNGSSFSLHGKPFGLLVDQGHTSNGAAGTAFVGIGLGGLLALHLRDRASRAGKTRGFAIIFYHFWLVLTTLAVMLALAALIYTFLLTSQHAGQTIDVQLASGLNNHPYPNYVAYPLQLWTPENWFTAVLKLSLESSSDRSDIQTHLAVMKGWRWNLIPVFLFTLAVWVLAIADAVQRRRQVREIKGYGQFAAAGGKRLSA